MAITQNQVDFALELLRKQYANSSESLVFSPVSISIGLAMCYGGAKGETKKQIGRILAGDGAVNEEDIHKHFSTIVKAVNTSGLDLQLDVANKMFADKDLPLVEEYAKKLESSYGCGIGHVDFSEHDKTAKEINQYVEDNTHEKIREIITPDVLKACQGAFVLINAIYFKAGWTKTFTESGTVKEPFHIAENQTKEVDMMHENFGKMPYYENDQVQVLKLPYLASVHGQAPAKCNLAMYVYLPKERFGLEKFLAGVNGKELTDIAGQMEEYFVKAALPRFKVESSFALKDVLSQMGMPEAFSDSADLSGIAKQPMRLAEVFHKTFIETNEKGTEAAAVTALFAEMRSMPAGNAEFVADHPFFYTICNREHDLLFCGVIRNF